MQPGCFVLSFDFELAWGLRRSSQTESAESAARYAHVSSTIVSQLLEILERYQLSATWGTVGQLMVRPEDCIDGRFPYAPRELAPQYSWFEGSWFDGIPAYESEAAGAYYAPHAVRAIVDCPVYQELASHTFSHAPLGDPACSADFARWELTTSRTQAAKWGRKLASVIFPRNEVGHLEVLRELGFRTYRGANSEWYWFGRANQLHRRRSLRYGVWVLRYFDEWSALTPPLLPVRKQTGLWEVPHSMFFPGMRGVSKLITPDQRVRRAVKGLQAAAEEGKVFSLWTHPHNFSTHAEQLLPAWEEICRVAAELRDAGRLHVLTMEQLADRLDAGEHRQWLAE